MAEQAREAILGRIREQLSLGAKRPSLGLTSHTGVSARADRTLDYAAIARTYDRAGRRTPEETIAIFVDRLLDYDAQVVRTSEAGAAAAVNQLLVAAGQKRVLVPAAFPHSWLPPEVEVLRDGANNGARLLTHAELDQIHAVLTTCAVAIAVTGTLLLQHKPEEGRRAITLVPDLYVCVVRASQIVETVPEGFARVQSPQSYPMTTVSGPSATADIEMTRIRGVHGPRHLCIVIVDGI